MVATAPDLSLEAVGTSLKDTLKPFLSTSRERGSLAPHRDLSTDRVDDDSVPNGLLGVILFLPVLSYPITWLFLIVLPLIALRAPAAGSLMDVNWSVYIPHL
ncbi:hypothetical protein C8J57DRAFT_1536910 [Mycena rebaudengoi]|nr:hypothetical protein C8J57DRAFT_1536910 [Mycena rebaudengoi]